MLNGKLETAEGGWTVTLTGRLDEYADRCLRDLLPQIQAASGPGAISLGGLTVINSVGAKLWVEFIRVAAAGGACRLTHCPLVFLEYAFLVAGFTGGAIIGTVDLNFVCRNCGTAVLHSLPAPAVTEGPVKGPAACARCGGELGTEFDMEEVAEGLRFLSE